MSRIPEAWVEERGPDKGVLPYKRFRFRKLKEMLESWEADGDIIIHEDSVCIDFGAKFGADVMNEREVLDRFQRERDVVRAWLRVRVPDHATQVCMYVCVCVFVYMCVCIYIYIYVCMYVYIYMHVCMYVHIYIYIYIY